MIKEFGGTLYDIIGILGYPIIVFFYLKSKATMQNKELLGTLSVYMYSFFSATKRNSKKGSLDYWIKKENHLFFLIHVISFTFAGEFFGSFFNKRTDAYGYLLITPLLFFVLCYIIGTNPFKQIDSITLAPALIVSLLKVSCFCAGCCPGLPTPYGLFNYDTGRKEFPIQLFEGFVYFLVFIVVLYLKKKIKRDGMLYPFFLSLYSLAKFLLQFFRSDEKVISVFNIHHFLSMFAFFVGIIWLVLVYKYGETIIRKFNREIKIKYIELQLNKHKNCHIK